MAKTHLIIGSSAASMGVLSKLRALDPQSRIICISSSTQMPYNTCLLADYVAGIREEQSLYTRPAAFFENNSIELRLNEKVISLRPEEKKVATSLGHEITYDTVFIGTGTSLTPPPIKGLDTHQQWRTFHTLEDSKKIVSWIVSKKIKQCVIIGAGLSGVECSDALRAHNIQVDLVEHQAFPLPYQLTTCGGEFLIERMKKASVVFHGSTKIIEITENSVHLSNGKILDCDALVLATGGRPSLDFIKNIDIAMHHNALVVNSMLATSLPDVYAGGDVAAVPDLVTQKPIRNHSWPDAMLQGIHAAHSMAGTPKPYPGFFSLSSSRFFDIQFVSCGPFHAPPHDAQLIERNHNDSYQAFLIHDDRLIGFSMLGTLNSISHYKSLIISQKPVTISDLQ